MNFEALTQSRFLRFGAVGAAGFVVDEAVLYAGHALLGLDPYTARVISILCAMTFTWWGNRTLTFAEHAAEGAGAVAREWLKFMLANALGAVANYATYTLCVRYAPAPLSNPQVGVVAGVAVGMVFNFTLSQRFVFRPK
ncbi:MAG TPA: GtrA family protein [Rhizomicrobium sp.]|nr:GtrA family protein [Rhizomicrobium sp.]